MKNKIIIPFFLLCCTFLGLNPFQPAAAQAKLSQGKAVTASSVESASYPASYAVDSDTATKWSSSGSGYNQWIYVDLGASYDIDYVTIQWADGRYATVFDVQASGNATTWTTLRTISSNTSSSIDTIAGLSGNYRYIKFNGRGRAISAGYRIADFSVYGVVPTTPAQQVSIDTITARLQSNYNSVVLNATSQSNVAGWMVSMQPDGHWASINYDDVSGTASWSPYKHLSRLKTFSYAYSNPSNPLYHDVSLRDKIQLGLQYYFYRNPTSTSWYVREIGAPLDYMVTLIMMKGVINRDSLLLYASYLVDRSGNASYEAKNRSWAATITIYKGCTVDSFSIVNTGFFNMATTLDVKTTTGPEGIKSDNSIHVHNTGQYDQLYSGGYGASMLADLADFIYLSRSTLFNDVFTTQRQKTLVSATLEGNQVLSYRQATDWGTTGRYISRLNGTGNMGTSTLDKMMLIEPGDAAALQAYKDHIGGAAFPAGYLGTNHFWKSDIMTYHGPNYYLSSKIISLRSCGTEMLGGENLKGYNLPLGATNIMTYGNEYTNIYPVWDWTRIPGTTAELNQAATNLTGYLFGTNAFGGGVSDDVNGGAIAFEQDYNAVQARKAYFFMGDAMVCLGIGIKATKSNTIATSVNQCYLSGAVTINNGVTTEAFTGSSQAFNDLQWIHHNNVGYLFPNGGYMTLEAKPQSGKWTDINTMATDTTTYTQNIFSIWFNHSTTPANRSYYYIVMPDKTLSAFQSAVANHGFVLVQNDANIQAIRNSALQNYAVIFHNPGTVDMGDGLIITVDKMALVYIHKYAGNYKISVADPLYNQSSVAIKVNKDLSGTNAVYANGFTTINVNFPTGDLTGKTVSGFYQINSASAEDVLKKSAAEDNSYSLYPNPATNDIFVKGLNSPALLQVYNAAGSLVLQLKGKNVNVQSLPAGFYSLHIVLAGGKVINKRFIKE